MEHESAEITEMNFLLSLSTWFPQGVVHASSILTSFWNHT